MLNGLGCFELIHHEINERIDPPCFQGIRSSQILGTVQDLPIFPFSPELFGRRMGLGKLRTGRDLSQKGDLSRNFFFKCFIHVKAGRALR